MLKNFWNRLLSWKVPLFYLGLMVLNYGIYIPWWGLYGDDWQYLYSFHLFGAGGYPAFVAADRPFSAWVYMLFTPLLGEHTWAYHILLFLLRWLAGLLFFQVVKAIWPQRDELAFWAGTVLMIYPGFRQQPLPLEFILHFAVLNLTLFSLFSMLRAQESKGSGWKWTVPGVVSSLGIFSVEYFTGLELLRPVLLWVKMRKSPLPWREKLGLVLRQWLPYLLVFIGFVVWRVFVFRFQHYKPSTAGMTNPLKYLMVTGWEAIESMWLALVKSWDVQINMQWGLPAAFAQLAALLIGFLAVFLLLRRVYPNSEEDPVETGNDFYWYPAVGLTALVLAGPLYWILGIPIEQQFPWDRPLLSFIPGAAILLAALLIRLVMPGYRSLLLAVLCAGALIANFHNAKTYMDEWHAMRSYLTQLTRRAPQLEPGTILMTQDLPFLYYGENTFFPILNWVYNPENRTAQMRVRMFDLSIRQGEAVTQLESGQVVTQNYRSFQFQSNREHVIAYTYLPPACLHVLSPDDVDYPHLPDWLRDLAFLSKPELIQLDAEKPADFPSVLSSPVSNTWCAYYQDAERERQKQNWEQVRQIAEAAESQGLKPVAGFEYLPFIEAFAQSGDWESAQQYFSLARSEDMLENRYLCNRWSKIADAINQEPARQLTGMYCSQ